MADERTALEGLLGRPPLRRLWTLVRDKLERRGGVGGSVRLDDADDAERAAVAALLGLAKLPPPERPLRVRLDRLDRVLRESRFAVGLEEAMAVHGGELRNRPAERAAEEERWRRLWRRARRHPLIVERPELTPWLDDLEQTGMLRRLARGRGEELLDRVFAALRSLPAGGVRLAVLASDALADSHALDPGHRVPALVLRAVARLAGREPPATAAARRELWAWAGVECDDLSCDVLVLGLAPVAPAPPKNLLHGWLRDFAAAGEPVRVTLRQLTRSGDVTVAPGSRVFVCENPAVVAVAADRLGASSPPLICLDGYPNTAARVLLRSLAAGGAELAYHGDFDWGGVRIANTLLAAVPFAPWRFTAADYRAATAAAETLELRGRPVDAGWDPELRAAMEEMGLAVEEEAVVETLVADLCA